MLCSDAEAVAHHIKGISHLSGVGMKCADYYTYGLCNYHHGKVHEMRNKESQWLYTATQIRNAIREGILQIDDGREMEFATAIGKLIDDGVLTVR